jgi:Uma2 family endonuclease
MTVDVPTKELISGEDLLAIKTPGRYELVEGEIVPMAPTGYLHGDVEGNFYLALKTFVRQHQVGKVMVGEVGIYTGRDPDTVRGADVLFVSHERYAQVQSSSFLDVAPELVVEILSPDDRWSEVMEKLEEYFNIGVLLVWVADPKTQSVYAYRSLTDVRRFTSDQELPGDEALPGFSVPVAELFAD